MIEQLTPIDLSSALADFNRTTTAREDASKSAYTLELEAHHKWKQLKALRERNLEQILRQRGLGVCSMASSHTKPEAWLKINKSEGLEYAIDIDELKKLEPQELGVFPIEELRLHFRRYTQLSYNGNPYLEGYYQFDELELLCREHFPDKTNNSWPTSLTTKDKKGNFDIESEIVKKDGKQVTLVGEVDVTDIPIKQHKNEMLYRFFDLPALPPEPR